jgi:feruloyl esterase
MYHGWSDQNVPPQSTINYYKSVLDKMGSGPQTDSWLRLFMAPGMAHSGGGEGPNQVDMEGSGSIDDAANFVCK